MSASDHLHPVEFSHHISNGKHVVTATHESGDVVGSMSWYAHKTVPHPLTREPLSGTITDIHTHPDFQGRGIATDMWKYGQQFNPPPAHSPSRTPEGDAWAKKVGGPRPPMLSKLSMSLVGLTSEDFK
jgi:hypothetical protein